MEVYKVIHIFDKQDQIPAMINEGLIEHHGFIPFFYNDVISIGQRIKKRIKNTKEEMLNCDFIILRDFIIPKSGKNKFFKVINHINKFDLWYKVIYYDQLDNNGIDQDILNKCFLYCKRTWHKKMQNMNKFILPFGFGALNAYYKMKIKKPKRKIDLLCTLPFRNPGRIHVLETLQRQKWKGYNVQIGDLTMSKKRGRNAIWKIKQKGVISLWKLYFNWMNSAKIIFTAYPGKGRKNGDSRTWEAMSSGALVFMDITDMPTENYFEHGKHCFKFDAFCIKSINKAIEKAKEMLENNKLRQKIALEGYNHTKKYHSSLSRVDFLYRAIQAVKNNTQSEFLNLLLKDFNEKNKGNF